jgi:hypothetical protein
MLRLIDVLKFIKPLIEKGDPNSPIWINGRPLERMVVGVHQHYSEIPGDYGFRERIPFGRPIIKLDFDADYNREIIQDPRWTGRNHPEGTYTGRIRQLKQRQEIYLLSSEKDGNLSSRWKLPAYEEGTPIRFGE